MGSRKHQRAERLKEERKSKYFASLKNSSIAPRKMRLVADMVRGKDVNTALDLLRYSPKHASRDVEKLLLSAIANWQTKNEGVRIEDAELFISGVRVDGGRILKRLQPAPQGRAHRIRKRSNHITIELNSFADIESETEEMIDNNDEISNS